MSSQSCFVRTLIGCSAVLLLAADLVAGQNAPAPAKPGAAARGAHHVTPRTPWGDPDLQGVWTTDAAYGIPLQRPKEFGTRAELSDQEFKEKEARDKKRREEALRGGDGIGEVSSDSSWLTRTFRQNSLIVDPADGQIPAMTPAGRKRQAAAPRGTMGNGPLDSSLDFRLFERCITLGPVGSITPKIYGNGHRIVQAPGYVVLMNEMIHEARIIPLDGSPHAGKSIQLYMGDSRGRWEGETLVIETTNLNGTTNYTSTDMVLIERITRVEPELLRYEAIINDPATYVAPFKISIPLTSPAGYQIPPFECHEGNRVIEMSLGAERAEDKALEEDRKKGINRPRRPIDPDYPTGR